MKQLAYITDLENKPGGGGSYAVNFHIQQQLQKHFALINPGPIVPRVSRRARFISRVQRYVLQQPSDFFYFSPATLDSNAARAAQHYGKGVDAVLFRSATRWCHSRPQLPYFVYLDIVFHTFFENTFRSRDFKPADLQRIFRAEAGFLENAAAVFFESEWGLRQAREAYGLRGRHYHAVGRGGLLAPPDADTWAAGEIVLLSIAMNFEQKGGDIILKAFKALKPSHPDLHWHIIGGRPIGAWETEEGIVYEGMLDPGDPGDLERYRALLARAFLLLHPTREDGNPLVLTEAAYFGCPAISVKRFAIPELVLDGGTGLLLDFPAQPAALASAIQRLIDAPEVYRQMRRAAFDFARSQFDWQRIGERVAGLIASSLEQRG